jgi:hypothetical protein
MLSYSEPAASPPELEKKYEYDAQYEYASEEIIQRDHGAEDVHPSGVSSEKA